MIHLQSFQLRKFPGTFGYPDNLPLLQSINDLRFVTPVTVLVGENGTGKSTLLEGLACAAEMVVVGSESSRSDLSLAHELDDMRQHYGEGLDVRPMERVS